MENNLNQQPSLIFDENNNHFMRQEYANKQFWDDRFEKKQGHFDWYIEYKQMKVYLEEEFKIKKNDKILIVGCGNSKLSMQMFKDGYSDLLSIDISENVITQMQRLANEQNQDLKYQIMDCTNLQLANESFDVVIDKGTLDALACGKDFVTPCKMLSEVNRVMKKQAKFILVTHQYITN